MKKTIDCIAINETTLKNTPNLKTLILMEAIYFDHVTGTYYIPAENPLSSLLLVRFDELDINPRPISVTIN